MSRAVKDDLKAAKFGKNRVVISWTDQVVEEWLGSPRVPVAWPCTIMRIVDVEDRKHIGDF
jgi:hypothetical protein